MTPPVRFARSDGAAIAYQVVGDGPIDLVFVEGFMSHRQVMWELPAYARFCERLAEFTRLILFDKRGVGMSDRVSGAATLETRMDDIRAVMDAVGSERAARAGRTSAEDEAGGRMNDVEMIERDRIRALLEADVDRAARLHADDFQLITPSGRVLSKEGYLEAVRSGDIDYALWEAGEIVVRSYGDVAVIRYPSEMAFTVGGTRTPRGRYWHTDLYERRDGRWQVVWSQATASGG